MIRNVPAIERVRVLLRGCAAAIWVAGCAESVAPAPSVEVDVTAEGVVGEIFVSSSGMHAECEVGLVAAAEGDAGIRAGWGAGWLDLTPTEAGKPLQLSLSPAEMQQRWGAPSILAGQTQYSSFSFLVPGPSVGTGEVRYAPAQSHAERQATFDFRCDPDLPGGSPPWLFDLSMDPQPEEMEPGPGPGLQVRYSAGSPSGLVEIGIRAEGAFTGTWPRQTAQTQESSFGLVRVPSSSALDQPFTLYAYAVDRTGSRTDSVLGPPIMVRDHTPPVVASAFLDPGRSGTGSTFEGQYAAGDTLRLSVTGEDNHRIAYVIYTLGAPANHRDSVAVPPELPPLRHIDIPVRPEWAGTTSLTVQVRDVAGFTSPEKASEPGKFSIVTRRERPYRETERDGRFEDFAIDAARKRIYLALNEARRLDIVSLEDLSVVRSIAFPHRVASVDLSPDGGELAVLLSDFAGVTFLDADDPGAPPRTVPVEGLQGYYPWVLRYTAAGRLLIVAFTGSDGRIVQFDPASGAESVRVPAIQTGTQLRAVRTDDYAKIAFFTDRLCGLLYESSGDVFHPCRVMEEFGEMSVSADGSRFAKGYVVYDSSLGAMTRLPLVTGNTGTGGLAPDGETLILGGSSGLMRMRVSDGAALELYPLPPMYNGAVRFIDGGATMVVVSREPQFAADRTVVRVVDLD